MRYSQGFIFFCIQLVFPLESLVHTAECDLEPEVKLHSGNRFNMRSRSSHREKETALKSVGIILFQPLALSGGTKGVEGSGLLSSTLKSTRLKELFEGVMMEL